MSNGKYEEFKTPLIPSSLELKNQQLEDTAALMGPASLVIDVNGIVDEQVIGQPLCKELLYIICNILNSELAPRVLGMKFLGKSWKDVVARSEISGVVLGTLAQIGSIVYAKADDLTPEEQAESANTVRNTIGVACVYGLLLFPIVHKIGAWLERGWILEPKKTIIRDQILKAPTITQEILLILKNFATELNKDNKLLTLGTASIASASFGLVVPGASFFASAGYAGIAKLVYDYFNQDPHAMTPDKIVNEIIGGNKDINAGNKTTPAAMLLIGLKENIAKQIQEQSHSASGHSIV